jgi:hypothetical protein
MKRGTLSSSQTIESTDDRVNCYGECYHPASYYANVIFQPYDKNQTIGECCHPARNDNIYVTIQPDCTHLRIHIITSWTLGLRISTRNIVALSARNSVGFFVSKIKLCNLHYFAGHCRLFGADNCHLKVASSEN